MAADTHPVRHMAKQCALALFSLAALVSCSGEQAGDGQPGTATEELATQADARSQQAVTLEDYQRAEQFLAANTNDLISGAVVGQWWQEDDSLIYERSTLGGSEYVLAEPASASKTVLFTTADITAVLSAHIGEEQEEDDVNLGGLELMNEGASLAFDHDGDRYLLDLAAMTLGELESVPDEEFLSPDGNRAVFIEDHNLWMRDTRSNALTQLTFDGVENYGYGTNNAGWIRDDRPVLLWSPDSSSIATFRHDSRQVEEMMVWSTRVGHPELDLWKYPLPGDDHIFMIERIVINLEPEPRVVKLDMPPDAHRSTTADHVAGRGDVFLDVEWSADSRALAFVSSSRDHKVAELKVADPDTGAVRDVLREEVDTYFEGGFSNANWRVLHTRNEFIWFSERDNWGHLYLYDLESGELKRQLTSGNWAVLDVQQVDEAAGTVYFSGSNREAGDPYYHYLYRLDIDSGEVTLLTNEPAHHVFNWSDSGDYFVHTVSSPTTPAVVDIRARQGDSVMALETMDISALEGAGWIAPEPFVVKARDQVTDIYGLMYTPSNFDESQSYPVLNYLYPGPQTGSVGSRSFRASRNDKQALAELGFIVVELDAMGTPGRSKAFHDAYYGNMGDNGLPDQIAGIRQLAQSRPWMDLDRVGIWGHSGGGFASTAGILQYPDFYKVAVSGAGNHDNRNYEDDWGEKWQGLLETYPESTPGEEGEEDAGPATNYDNQANQLLADQLQGKLLLAHGMMDTNVHPSSTLLVVDALIDAEKDFDLVILPNAGHGFGNRRYFMKRRWDYFVEHLKGVQPPAGFRFQDNIN